MSDILNDLIEQSRINLIIEMIRSGVTKEQLLLASVSEEEYAKAEEQLYANA